MTESNHDSPELVPYFVSFEGMMSVEKLAEIVTFLGEISTEMQVSVRVGSPEIEVTPEESILDAPIGVNDFWRVAEENGISKVLAGRTISIINRYADSLKESDKDIPDCCWYKNLLRPTGGYSSRALKEALLRGDLEAVSGMGPKSCELVEMVIADTEAQALFSAGEEY